ncbi:MAG TPA: selenocysteine-specific translation elongation factor [Acidimicrobiia bacterium]|nr:selenocysteine-specific translation elongation factor [Acidimicrobiia bacterium]
MPVVGTAGHVDHGKSTLVLALSGRDPDRWAEEKRRGLTIDLGFAWAEIGGEEVSFVDVPGHERYSKNMLAGIEAIDVALLVVAADEGWMPQSEEHLAVLDLLGVDRAVVALTKVDRVDEELVELATLEIEERLAGTTLAGSPIVAVSAVHDSGMDLLRGAIVSKVKTVPIHDVARPRLWVDRVFSAPGAGTVVTGTLLDGSISVDDRLVLFPGGSSCRVRGIQSHERDMERVEPQRRVALNLGGVSADAVARGAMLGHPDQWSVTDSLAIGVRSARYADLPTGRGSHQLHIGSGAWPVRLRPIENGTAVIDLPSPLPLAMGDRFILRDTGRRRVVAGGRVLDPKPPRVRRLRPHIPALQAAASGDPHARATALLAVRELERAGTLAAQSGGGEPDAAVRTAEWRLTVQHAESLSEELSDLVRSFHRDHPLRIGIPTAEAASRLGVEMEIVEVVVGRSVGLAVEGSHLRMRSFEGGRTPEQEADWQRLRQLLETSGASAAPRVDELDVDPELVHALTRQGELVRITEQLVLLPDQVDRLIEVIRSFGTPFTVAEFRDRSGLSRKYAVPFLEWADAAGHTVRQGDTRRVR